MSTSERPRALDDPTPLNGPTIDVAARIGWTLRMARITSGGPDDDPRLRTLAAQVGSSAAQLSRLETGQRRDGTLIDGYEEALGLPEGSLRSPVDILCRTFPGSSPRDSHPGQPLLGVREMSALTDKLLSDEPVTGGEWFRWGRSLALPGNHALPTSLFVPVVTRLINELARSAGQGYPVRYEALALLRRSSYGYVVLEVAQDVLDRPHAQGLGDLMSAVGESSTPEAVEWCLDLLRDPRDFAPVVAALALENMDLVDGPLWERIAEELISAFDYSKPGSVQEEWTAHLIRLAPSSLWQSRGLRPARQLPQSARITDWSRHQTNALWRSAWATSTAMTSVLDLPRQPMLTRLVFEIAYGHWESRAVTSYMLLGALPRLSASLGEHMAAHAEESDDPQVRSRVLRRLIGTVHAPLTTTERWLSSDDPEFRAAALQAAGQSGQVLPTDHLRRMLVDPDCTRQAIYAAGMSAHPELAAWVDDETLPHDVRGALRWWHEQGGRLVA